MAFSTFEDPRPAPSPPTSSSHRSSLRKRVSDSCLSVKGLPLNSDDGSTHDHYIYGRPVRRGHISVQRDRLRSWSWTRRLWVVLDNQCLYLCQREVRCCHALYLYPTHCVSTVFYSYSDSSPQTCSRSRASPMPATLPRCRHLLRHVVSPLQRRHLTP